MDYLLVLVAIFYIFFIFLYYNDNNIIIIIQLKKIVKNKPLIYNSDIKALSKKDSLTPDEMLLIPLHNALETKIQTYCHNLAKHLAFDLERKYDKKVIEFIQIDNGGKMGIRQKCKKKAEGTKEGFCDTEMLMGNGKQTKNIYVEFKRISTPSNVVIKERQQYYHDWLRSIGYEAYITNNPLYFRDIVLGSVKDFFDTI